MVTAIRNLVNPTAQDGNFRQRHEDGRQCREAARRLLDLGLSVLALCPPDHVGVGKAHGKTCHSPGKVPVDSWKAYQERLPYWDEFREKWDRNPTLNIGAGPGSRQWHAPRRRQWSQR